MPARPLWGESETVAGWDSQPRVACVHKPQRVLTVTPSPLTGSREAEPGLQGETLGSW